MKQTILFLALVFFIYTHTTAKNEYQLLDATSGLPHQLVNQAVQDKKGFMWFATANGLARYDGNSFLVFRLQQYPALYSNHISSLLCDNKGFLWIGTDDGLNRMNPDNYEITRVPLPHNKSNVPNNFITGILQSTNGSIWIGTQSGDLFRYGSVTEHVYSPKKKRLQQVNLSNSICEDGSSLWLRLNYDGLVQLDLLSGKVKQEFFFKDGVFGMINTKKYGLLVYSKQILTYKAGRFLPMGIVNKKGNVSYMYTDDREQLYWQNSASDSLYTYSGDRVMVMNDMFGAASWSLYRVKNMYEDRLHNLWICTGRGVIHFSLPDRGFHRYLADSTGGPYSVRGITQTARGDLYFSGYGFLNKLEKNSGKIKRLTSDVDNIYSMVPGARNTIWLITEGMGVQCFDISENKLLPYPGNKRSQVLNRPNLFLTSAFKEQDNTLWLSCYDSIIRFNPATDRVWTSEGSIDGIVLRTLRGRHFYESLDGHLWVGTDKGLFELDTQRKPIRHFSGRGKQGQVLSDSYVNNIIEDDNGMIWIGTAYGLNKLNRTTGEITIFTTKNGLADNTVVSMLKDKYNRLWIATNNGLSNFDTEKELFYNFHTEDGLSHNEFNHNAFFQSPDGTMYFGGLNGITAFKPENIRSEYEEMPLLFTQVHMRNGSETGQEKNIPNTGKPPHLHIPADNRYFRIQFALADYTDATNNLYAYKLEGYDKDWVHIDRQAFVSFTALPAGNYTLLVKAAGSKGIWTSTPRKLFIHVAKPFYAQWWFILICFVLLVMLLYIFYRNRIRQIQQLANMRINISSDLHDEVGSVLTHVAMQADMLRFSSDDKKEGIITAIAENCRNAVSNMRDVVWAIDARNDMTDDLEDRMTEHLQKILESAGYNYTFEKNTTSEKISTNDRQHLFLIFKEAINNIVKHSNGSKVDIVLFKKNTQLELRIRDNGFVPPSGKSSGSGLKNMKMRAEKIKAMISVTHQDGFEILLQRK